MNVGRESPRIYPCFSVSNHQPKKKTSIFLLGDGESFIDFRPWRIIYCWSVPFELHFLKAYNPVTLNVFSVYRLIVPILYKWNQTICDFVSGCFHLPYVLKAFNVSARFIFMFCHIVLYGCSTWFNASVDGHLNCFHILSVVDINKSHNNLAQVFVDSL